MAEGPRETGVRLDLVGTALSALGLGLIVFGHPRAREPGASCTPKPDAPEWLGLSPVIWLILGGGVVLWLFFAWENRRIARGAEPLVDPAILRVPVLRRGLTSFFFQYFLQGGLFFAVPLFLSVALGLSAIETGVRLLPLSVTLILAAAGVPKLFPDASPRRVVRIGFAGAVRGIGGADRARSTPAPGPRSTTWPMLLAGLGIGALASQLGSVTVSSVPDEQSGEVGGLQNTITNLGISVGTALTGAIIISALTASFLTGIEQNPAVPDRVTSQAQTELAGGAPFVSDSQLQTALDDAHVPPRTARRNRRRERDGPDQGAAHRARGAGPLHARRAVLQPPAPHRAAREGGRGARSGDLAARPPG